VSGFGGVRDYVRAHEEGRQSFCSFRKVPSQASVAGWWVDLSMAAGNPKPNYYASEPLVAATLPGFGGMLHGDDKAPGRKFMTEWSLCTPTAGLVGQYKLLDYLLYYPFIDGDDLDAQVLDNTVELPRYQDGDGVRVMAVAVAPSTGGGRLEFDYIDHEGNLRTSPVNFLSVAAANIASLLSTEPATAGAGGPFLALASGSTGLRRIVEVRNIVANGGLFALVLVKPLADHAVREIGTPSVRRFAIEEGFLLPQIEDDAYLNPIMNCAATVAAGQVSGSARFLWSD
jgi:hypothetical protein